MASSSLCQCKHLKANGARCRRQLKLAGYCYQHLPGPGASSSSSSASSPSSLPASPETRPQSRERKTEASKLVDKAPSKAKKEPKKKEPKEPKEPKKEPKKAEEEAAAADAIIEKKYNFETEEAETGEYDQDLEEVEEEVLVGELLVRLKNKPAVWTNVGKVLVTFSESDDEEGGEETAHIAEVTVAERFQGRGLCREFVRAALQEILSSGRSKISITNASLTLDGVPACFCYMKAAEDLGLAITTSDGEVATSAQYCPTADGAEAVTYFFQKK